MGRDHLIDAGHHHVEERHKFGIVFRSDCESTYLAQTAECDVSKFWSFQELKQESASSGRDSEDSSTRDISMSIKSVSKMYPRGIQLQKRRLVQHNRAG